MLKILFNNAQRHAAIERARRANHEAFSLPETSFTSDRHENGGGDVEAKAMVGLTRPHR